MKLKKIVYISISLVLCFSEGAFAQRQQMEQNMGRYQLGQQYEAVGDYNHALEIYRDLYQRAPKNYTYFDAVYRTYINLKQYDQLITFIENHLQLEPSNLQIKVQLGDAYFRKGDENKAYDIWHSILNQYKNNPAIYRMIANSLIQNRQYDKSIEIYEQGRQKLNNPSIFALELAQLHTYRLNYDKATNEYLRFLSKNPNQLAYVEARLADFKGDFQTYKQVTTELRHWINQQPANLNFRKLLISFLISYENYQEAFTEVKELERLKSKIASKQKQGAELMQFGLNAITEKQYASAQKAFLEVLQSYPDFPDKGRVEYEIGRSYFLQDDIQKALVYFERIAKEYPKSPWALEAYMMNGKIFMTKRFNPDSAAQNYIQVTKQFPNQDNWILALLSLGDVEIARGNLDHAKSFYQKALQKPIKNPALQLQIQIEGKLKLAQLAFYQKDFEQSKRHLQAILDNQAQHLNNVYINDALDLMLLINNNKSEAALAQYAEASLLVRQHRFQKATEKFDAITKDNPESDLAPRAYFKIAELKEKIGDYLSAVVAYQAIVDQFENYNFCDLSLWQIGRIYETQLKDNAKAIEYYEQILLKYPNSMLSEKARKKIRKLEGQP